MVLRAIQYVSASDTIPPRLEILDQLALPYSTSFLQIHTCEDAFTRIKQMNVRGAPAIAIVAALALAVEIDVAQRVGSLPEDATGVKNLVCKSLEYLKGSRPTAVNLGDAVGKLKMIVKRAALEQNATAILVAQKYTLAAEKMLTDDVKDNEAIGKYGAHWIKGHTGAGQGLQQNQVGELKVLTHCNTGYAGV